MAIITIPSANDANTNSIGSTTSAVNDAQTAFIASTAVLITNAIANGFFQVQPYLPSLVSPAFVTTYFTNLGYTVLFPVSPGYGCNCNGNPGYPYEPCFVTGFPEVLPPGYVPWNCGCGYEGPVRIGIYWKFATNENVFLLENGDFFELENKINYLLLES